MLAVLPVENLSREPEQEYFSDGLTEEMIARLGSLPPEMLGVIARTSAMRYKNTTKSITEIGRELGVDYILEGTVRRGDGNVRITAQLILVRDQTHLWAQTFDRTVSDVLAVQAEVAAAVAEQIELKLTPQQQARLANVREVDPEAHELYLKGRYYWNKRTEADFNKAIDYFQQAIRIDPTYAPGYAGLADSYTLLGTWDVLPPRQARDLGKEAALKALSLDDRLAEAHASLALILHVFDWDWTNAETEFKRAIELNPSYATAHLWYSLFLTHQRRFEEAWSQTQRARELDPLSLAVNAHRVWCLLPAGRVQEAIEAGRATVELDPNFGLAHYFLGWCYVKAGMSSEAVTSFERALAASETDESYLAALGHAYALAGMTDRARDCLDKLMERSEGEYVSAYNILIIHAALGEKEEAFRWMEKAYEQRGYMMRELLTDPSFDPLRDDPRFDQWLRRMNLPAPAPPAAPPPGAVPRPDAMPCSDG